MHILPVAYHSNHQLTHPSPHVITVWFVAIVVSVRIFKIYSIATFKYTIELTTVTSTNFLKTFFFLLKTFSFSLDCLVPLLKNEFSDRWTFYLSIYHLVTTLNCQLWFCCLTVLYSEFIDLFCTFIFLPEVNGQATVVEKPRFCFFEGKKSVNFCNYKNNMFLLQKTQEIKV